MPVSSRARAGPRRGNALACERRVAEDRDIRLRHGAVLGCAAMSVSLPVGHSGPPAARVGSRFSRLVGAPWLWVALAALGFAVPLAALLRTPPRALPEYGALPSFSLLAE